MHITTGAVVELRYFSHSYAGENVYKTEVFTIGKKTRSGWKATNSLGHGCTLKDSLFANSDVKITTSDEVKEERAEVPANTHAPKKERMEDRFYRLHSVEELTVMMQEIESDPANLNNGDHSWSLYSKKAHQKREAITLAITKHLADKHLSEDPDWFVAGYSGRKSKRGKGR